MVQEHSWGRDGASWGGFVRQGNVVSREADMGLRTTSWFPRSVWIKASATWSHLMGHPALSRRQNLRPPEVLSSLNYPKILYCRWKIIQPSLTNKRDRKVCQGDGLVSISVCLASSSFWVYHSALAKGLSGLDPQRYDGWWHLIPIENSISEALDLFLPICINVTAAAPGHLVIIHKDGEEQMGDGKDGWLLRIMNCVSHRYNRMFWHFRCLTLLWHYF